MAYRGSLKGEMINIAREDEQQKTAKRPKFLRDLDAKIRAKLLLVPMMTGGTQILSEKNYYKALTEILREKGLCE